MLTKNSLLYWYPKIQKLDIPTPLTKMIRIPQKRLDLFAFGERNLKEYWPRIKSDARAIGYPLFLRTDLSSNKHSWKKSCYVESEDVLPRHVFNVCEFSHIADMMGLPHEGIVLREYIEMDWKFRAFYGQMPVSRERRYFIKDGKIQCSHPYWPPGAIEESGNIKILPTDWKRLLKKLNKSTKEETELLSGYAKKVAQVLDGYWSVDFCCSKKGKWLLIDCALGEESWHWPSCIFRKEPKRLFP